MKRFQHLALAIGALAFSLTGCDSSTSAVSVIPPADALTNDAANWPILVTVIEASLEECARGGSVILTYRDTNKNAVFDATETPLSRNPVCNGTNGRNGNQGANGFGAGILVSEAGSTLCAEGGAVLTSFVDKNNNALKEAGEDLISITTLCNGRSGTVGQDGRSAHLSVTAASLSQCPAGGAVYSSGIEGAGALQTTVVCNGQEGAQGATGANGTNGTNGANGADGINGTNGTNGTNGSNGTDGSNGRDAHFLMGAVGDPVPEKTYSACHHDYLYFPDAADGARGWLMFRHQSNGANDQGIGATGFQVWNIDISDFMLVSEVGAVPYCRLHWEAAKKVLSYEVIDRSDGLEGKTGSLQF